MPQTVKAGLRGAWPCAGSRTGSGSREMFVEDRYARMRAQGDQLSGARCESEFMDASQNRTSRQVDHVPDAQALADFSPQTATSLDRMTSAPRRSPPQGAACGFWIRAWS